MMGQRELKYVRPSLRAIDVQYQGGPLRFQNSGFASSEMPYWIDNNIHLPLMQNGLNISESWQCWLSTFLTILFSDKQFQQHCGTSFLPSGTPEGAR